jgi:streptomycin 6-kinase
VKREPASAGDRIEQLAREWRLVIEESFETNTSVISFARRDGEPLVLKLIKQPGDEWRAGEVLSAFKGKGVVRVHESTAGAMLLERLEPGNNLVERSSAARDEEATDLLIDVIREMASPDSGAIIKGCPTVEDWGEGFARYLVASNKQIPRDLVESAQSVFADLCASQGRQRLLHGDLHHYNVLFDSKRGWLAIDPKGIIGELEYEVGAILRNPVERPDLFLSPAIIERRVDQLTNKLNLNRERVMAWAFSQAVLSAIWEIEDGSQVETATPVLRLARIVEQMI